MKIIVFGAHPDDCESGCGGLIVNAVQAGHEVHCLYATAFREGRLCFGRPEKEVRTEEATAACRVMGATAEFLEYAHEHIDVNLEDRRRLASLLVGRQPDVLLAHWPVDTHPDHRAVGVLALEAFLSPEARFDFYYFEVMTGRQSLRFMPTHYVDITDSAARKRQACFCHRSQNPEAFWAVHDAMHRFRGWECGVEKAEAYVKLDRGGAKARLLPGMTPGRA
ncbi:MAG: PIG-L family deacetylase [Kiritimatiellae bacterium]|nr:PIG-L family deacetylase [Kiritimatiellia bacterium]